MKRRILSFLLSIIFVLGAFTETAVYADAETFTVAIGTVSAKAGETVKVPVTFSSNPGVAMFELELSYDTTKMTLSGYECLIGGDFTCYPATGKIVWVDGKNASTDGTAFTLTFTIADNAKGDVSVRFSSTLFSNLDENILNPAFTDGSIKIECTHIEDGGTVTKQPSCTEQGIREYRCMECGEVIRTENIPTVSHDTELKNAKKATCTEEGYTGDAVCKNCKQTITAGEVIPACGHTWGKTTYTWSDDKSVCTASRSCTAEECKEEQTASGTITYTISQPKPCTEAGDTTYTAKFTEDWAETQTETVKGNIKATGHKYGNVSYEWSEDGKVCTATHTCTVEGCNQTEAATATVTSVVKAPASCSRKGITTYTARFAENWAVTQVKDIQDIELIAHTYGETVYLWADDGSNCSATHTCLAEGCSYAETAQAVINYDVKIPATLTEKGWTRYTAVFTEEWAETQTKDIEDIPERGCRINYVLGNERAENLDNPEIYEKGNAVTLASPKLNGYTFAGWFLDDEFTQRADAPQIKAEDEGEKTFYAKWTMNSYSIKFNSNGGSGSVKTLTKQTDKSGDIVVNNKVKRTGYKFAAWNTKADGSGESYSNTLTIYELAPYADAKNVITLYAQWEPISYTIEFDDNGGAGEMNPLTMEYGTTKTIPQNAFTKTGYIFSGWKCGSKTYKDGLNVRNLTIKDGDTVKMTAQWTADKGYEGYSYTVKFFGNGSTGGKTASEPMRVGTAKALTANGFTKTGYHFIGWALSENGEAVYTNKQKVLDLNIPGGDKEIKLYAVWEKNSYTVTFNGNGGKQGKASAYTQSMIYDTEETLDINQFVRIGYTFKGWNTKKDGKGVSYGNNEMVRNLSSSANGKVTLYAIWEANIYTIVYKTEHGTGTTVPQIVSFDKSVKLNANAFSYPGYSFKNWTGSNGKTYSNQATVRNLCTGEDDEHNTIVLTANWSKNTYTVKFNTNGGKGTAPKQISCSGDSPVTIPESSLQFSGYTFKEWNTKSDGTGDSYSPGQNDVVFDTRNKATVTLYAVWTYSVTLNSGNGEGGEIKGYEMIYNRSATVQPETFSNPGCCLIGWNKDETKAAKGTVQYKVNAVKNAGPDATLYAVWKPLAYTIKFDANSGKGTMKNLSMTYGTAKVLTANAFTKTGAVFKEWNTAPDGTGISLANRAKVTTELVPESNKQMIILYAVWN